MINKYYKIVNLKESMLQANKFEISEELKRWFQEQKGYIFQHKLGEGLECAVYLINLSEQNPKPYALKITKLIKTDQPSHLPYPRQVLKLKLQSLILSNHLPNHHSLPRIKQSGFCKEFGFMVMEYLPKNNLSQFYRQYFSSHKTFEVSEDIQKQCLRYVLGQITLGLRFLADEGMIHRDIKMLNIMFDEEHRVKIIDFSMAIFQQTQNEQMVANIEEQIEDLQNDILNRSIKKPPPVFLYQDIENALKLSKAIHQSKNLISGSKQYLCPQSIAPQSLSKPLTCKIDVWALGVIAYRLFFGKFPIQKASELTNFVLFNQIRNAEFAYPSNENDDEQLKMRIQFVKGCLEKDHEKRLSAKQVLQLKYFDKLNFNSNNKSPIQYIYEQHNPITKILQPELFVSEWKWVCPQKMRIKFISEANQQKKQPFTYNKFSKLNFGIKQQSNGHHYLEFTNDKIISNKNNKNAKNNKKNKKKSQQDQEKTAKNEQKMDKTPLLRMKTKYCYINKDFSTKNKILVRIEILTQLKCQNEGQIMEIDVQFVKEEVLDDFLHAVAQYRR